MKTAYFDCFAGISGDMTIGALLDLGIDFQILDQELRKLKLEGWEIKQGKVLRGGVAATKFDVVVQGYSSHPESQEHSSSSSNSPFSSHLASHSQDHAPHSHRSLSEILQRIEAAPFTKRTQELAMTIFKRLGEAEARIHNVPVEQVHFHEVGAIDSIIDIVGTAIGLDLLGIERVIASSINVGAGFVECEHGTFPVPGPASMELLKGIPVYSAGPQAELTTPTGAAIISTIASEFRSMNEFRVEQIGYGAGSRTFDHFPNALRVMVGEEVAPVSTTPAPGNHVVSVIEANIDDMNPQIYGYVLEKAMTAGALDVFVVPVQMKKNRPGQCLTIICETSKVDELTRLVFSETTTIGLRIHSAERRVLDRTLDMVQTTFGKVRIKVSRLKGAILTATPEYEDCLQLAKQNGVPLKDVMGEANAQIRTLKFKS